MTDSQARAHDSLQAERRQGDRNSVDLQVTVHFSSDPVVGSGENIAPEGMYCLAEGPLPVRVRIEGQDKEIQGQLVRVAAMGDGKMGIAVKFV